MNRRPAPLATLAGLAFAAGRRRSMLDLANAQHLAWAALPALLGFLGGVAMAAAAPPPNLVDMDPHGGQRGRALQLVIEGYGLPGQVEIESTLPASFARLGPAADADRLQKLRRLDDRNLQAAVFLVEIADDAAPGLYPLRVVTEDGLSNALLFRVDSVPEVSERSLRVGTGPATQAEAPAVEPLPIVVNGTLDGAERDRYRFVPPPGERIVIEVEARRVGSAIDPTLRLLDRDGREVAFNQDGAGIDVDARLDWRAPEQGGEFTVEVHDARFSDQRRNFYRLKLVAAADYDYADAVFPLGRRAGETTRFELAGGTVGESRTVERMAGRTAESAVDARSSRAAFDLVGPEVESGSGSAALPFPIAVGGHPEVREAELEPSELLEAPVTVNGRIALAGEVDRYRVAARPGEKLLIEIEGARLGASDLFGVLTVTTPDGEYLASSGDDIPDPDTFRLFSPTATSFDPWVIVEAPEDVDALVILVEDLVGRGGARYGYRLSATATDSDFELELRTSELSLHAGASKPVEVGIVRRGYLGPIRLFVEDPAPGIEARDAFIPNEVTGIDRRSLLRSGRIMLTADVDAPRIRLDLAIWGEGVHPDGTVFRRRATVPGSVTSVRAGDGRTYTTEAERSFSAPWLETRLPVLLTGRPGPRLLGLVPETVRLVKGMPFDFRWKFEPPAGTDGTVAPPMTVNALIGIGVGEFRVETTVPEDYNQAEGSKLIRSSDGTRHDRYTVTLVGEVNAGGRPERVYTPGVTLDIVPGYRIEVARAIVAPGSEGAVEGVLHREPNFHQPVELRADALPAGVVCGGAELPAESEGSFRLECEASDDVEAGDHEFLVTSSSWLAGEREVRAAYTTAPVSARMEVKAR